MGRVLGVVALMAVVVAGAVGGCAGGGQAPAAGSKACVLRVEGRDVLRVSVPADAECTATEGRLNLKAPDRYVDIWVVPGAHTMSEVSAGAGRVITPEFHEFKVKTTVQTTVAGKAAERLTGSGTEADDGDPGEADLIVFGLGDRVFVACTHGESILDVSRAWMVTVVQSAALP